MPPFSSQVCPRRHVGWLLIVALTAASSAALPGCQQRGEGPGHRYQPLALSPQEELALGTQAYNEFKYKYRNRIVSQGPEVERVQRVAKRIAQAATIRPLQREINLHFNPAFFEWEYTVFEDNQINAFCMPGGKIGVFTGLLRAVGNSDDQLAAVLGHEVAHALAHHASERLARQKMLPAGGKSSDPHQRNQIMDILAGLSGLAHDREQESEADHIGLFLMTFAGYDPRQAVVFWENMQKAMAGQGRPPEILSDHPSDQRRIDQLKAWVPNALAAKQAYDSGRIAP
jgi:predicted Zn-dependent protease